MGFPMRIHHYSFGSMEINGRTYDQDLIIFREKIISGWWRKEGHSLALKDLEKVIDYEPDLLIVGTGAYGVMRVPSATLKALEEKGIETICLNTRDAVDLFNRQNAGKKVVGAFHLTC